MPRSMDSNFLTAITSANAKIALFVEMFFASGTLRLHNGVGTITATESGGSPRTWDGTGDLGQIAPMQENETLKSYDLSLQLSGCDTTITNIALNEQFAGRVAIIYGAAFDANDLILGNLTFLWRGRMDRPEIDYGDDANVINIVCESELTTLLRTRNGYFTDAGQQQRFASDRGFQYMPQMPLIKIQWGGKTVKNTSPQRYGTLGGYLARKF